MCLSRPCVYWRAMLQAISDPYCQTPCMWLSLHLSAERADRLSKVSCLFALQHSEPARLPACLSVRLSLRLSLRTPNLKKKGTGKPKLTCTFPRAGVTGVVPIFSSKGQRSGRWPHSVGNGLRAKRRESTHRKTADASATEC